MTDPTTTTTTRPDALRDRTGEVDALLFGAVAARCYEARSSGELERARGLAEACEILSGIPAGSFLERR